MTRDVPAEILAAHAVARDERRLALAAKTNQTTCQHLLGVLDYPGGIQPGSFTTHLIRAALVADPFNRARLDLAFPEVMAAAHLWDAVEGGQETVERIAAGEKP